MGVPKKRMSKMRRNRRRAANSNLRTPVQTVSCSNCGATVIPHRVCAECGHYGGKQVVATRDE